MTLRLKRLEIQGFKSFANRTVFDLAEGLTAVIGPNGSGKSNFSEAVRWALGEQSNTALRGRKGEDVIFAGSSGRAALGMAEVALTLDNSDGGLPLDFSEVTIARRIFRDGETHYLINGGRVRLRDVLQVTAPLGQSYTVIGQGLVDAALSARPEERRGLFEHAAGIAPFRMKRAEAERRLVETETNCARLLDLRAELEPRIRSLERAAKGAQEYTELRERLRGLHERLFADLWRETHATLAAAEAEEGAAREARGAADHEIARLNAAVAAAVAATEVQGRERHGLAEQAAEVARRLEPLRRDLAIGAERLSAIGRRLTESRERVAGLATRRAALTEESAAADSEAARIATSAAAARQEAEAIERTLGAVEGRRAGALHAARRLAEQIATTERERLTLARRRAATEERRAAIARDRERATVERAAAQERQAALNAELAEKNAAITRNATRREAATVAQREAGALVAAATGAEREASAAQTTRERHLAEVRARLEGLQKLAASGEGFFTGVRAVLAAARARQLQGVVGPVAGIIDVPGELETAIEIALGGHLQDIVVERWADAEAAIALLKERRAGRATFQPLDTSRGGAGDRRAPADGPGVLGVAADLVGHEARFAPLVGSLLGRTLIVEDLPTTRRILPRLSGAWSIVTRGGEITRTSGAVTGGSAARESGILARERALRELPQAVATAERELAAAMATVGARAAAGRAAREELARHEGLEREAAREAEDLRHSLARVERERRAVAETLGGLARRGAELTKGTGALTDELAIGDAEEAAIAERLGRFEAERVAATAALQGIEDTGQHERPRLTTLRAEIARAEEQGRGLRRQLEAAQAQETALAREAREQAAQVVALEREAGEVAAAATEHRARLAATETEATALAARLRPLDAALTAVRDAETTARGALGAANQEALRREATLGARAVETARRRAEVDTLTRRIVADMADMADATDATDTEQADLAARFAVPAPPLPADERAALESQTARLVARLRRSGPPSAAALGEWEDETARWKTLTVGLGDVESAARSLRGVLAELDRTMAERFNATFARVAEEFALSFADLFGGGAARLVLAEGRADDGDSGGVAGVEIIAQPPGKRPQALALLSGGERALTAAALLFAILRVSPSPFCVLDEVDAALDESNVVRFREQLKRLTDRTQFVVITHNRGTIEGADTLYGITMGADGVSRLLSMRLDGAALPVFVGA